MKLSGWQRSWLTIAAVWLPLLLWEYQVNISTGSGTADYIAGGGLVAGAVVLFVVYPLYVTVAWVRRGFMQAKPK